MPMHIEKREGMFRLVERGGHIARGKGGKPVDGGGHKTAAKAKKQIAAIEINRKK